MDLHMFFIPLAERSSLNNHHHSTETILALCENKVYNKLSSLHQKTNTLECIVCNKLFFDEFFDETPDFKKLENIYNRFWDYAMEERNIALFADELLLRIAEDHFRQNWVPLLRERFGIGYKFFGHLTLPPKEVNPVRMMISKIDSHVRIEPFFSEQDHSNFDVRRLDRNELHILGDRAMYFRQ